MIKTRVIFIVVLVLNVLASLTGCERILSGAERAAVLAYSETATDNLLAGLNANDYAAFSRDFDTDMQKVMPATNFAALKQDLDNKLGNYLSRQVDHVTQADEFHVVVYRAKFEQEESVIVEVAFHVKEPNPIAHLSFDSEKLRWSSQ